MFNFSVDLSDHPTLPGVKRRYTIVEQKSSDKTKKIEIIGTMFYYQLVGGIEVPVKDIAPDGIKGWPLYAENIEMVDATGIRVDIIPATDEVPAHYPDGSIPEYDYWMNTYYNLVKVQGQAVSIFDMYIEQILEIDSRGGFNL